MIDLTPLEVRKKKGDFRRTMRGYDPVLVDDFLDLVADRLEELVRENLTLAERVGRQEQQVAEYRDRERALTEALVSAQEMREEVRRQSQREAELAMQSAEQQAARMRADVEEESRQLRAAAEQQAAQVIASVQHERQREEDALHHLRARQQEFLSSYRALLEHEMEELGALARTLGARSGRDYSAAARGAHRADREPAAAAPLVPGAHEAEPGSPSAAQPLAAAVSEPEPAADMDPAPTRQAAAAAPGLAAEPRLPAQPEAPTAPPAAEEGPVLPGLPPLMAQESIDEYTGESLSAHDIEDEAALAMGATPADLTGFEPEPFEPEPFLPDAEGLLSLNDDALAIGEAYEAEQRLVGGDADDSDTTDVSGGGLEERLYEGVAGDESGDGVPGPIGLGQEPATPWEDTPWAPGADSPGTGEGADVEDDDDDPDTAALLRNAAAAGYRLIDDDDLPDELLLEEAVPEDNPKEDDGWLPGLLEDEK